METQVNFFQTIMHQLFGGRKGEAAYRTTTDIGKVLAPIAQPMVTQILQHNNLPVSGQAALDLLTRSATGSGPLGAVAANALSYYIGQHIALVTPVEPS